MLIPLGILASSGGAAGAYEQIATAFGTGSATQIDFTSVPQTYKHLQVRYTVLMAAGGAGATPFMRLNSDTGSNYSFHYLRGNGSAVSSAAQTSQSYMNFANPVSGVDTTIWNAGVIDLLDYTATTKNTTMRALTGMAGTGTSTNDIELASGAWYNTAAVTTVSLRFSGFAPTATSRFSLYGIKG